MFELIIKKRNSSVKFGTDNRFAPTMSLKQIAQDLWENSLYEASEVTELVLVVSNLKKVPHGRGQRVILQEIPLATFKPEELQSA